MLTGERQRLPSWFKTTLPTGKKLVRYNHTTSSIRNNALHTVCEEAKCPNVHDCWGRGTATFMVAGQHCTRGCRFCAVSTLKKPPLPDSEEPENLALAVENMGLSHVVITVVNRDDLEDSGASHYRACIDAVHRRNPNVDIEILCSDLAGDTEALSSLLNDAPLQVFAHNIECVERLTPNVRDPRASFAQSLLILETAKKIRPNIITKSSIMVGLGETNKEVTLAMQSLRNVGVDLLTLGQYLSPGKGHHPVISFPTPEQFDIWAKEAKDLGFSGVASGPLVRSSYRAGELLHSANGFAKEGVFEI